MTGRFTVVSERGDRVFPAGDAAVGVWRAEEDDRCARVRAAVLCSGFARGFVCASPCGAAVGGRRPESKRKIKSDMRKTNVAQIVRLGDDDRGGRGVIYALEYGTGIAVWFWITLLGSFVACPFRLTQRRPARTSPHKKSVEK